MKKLYLILIMLCGVFNTGMATGTATPVKQPTNVNKCFNSIIEKCGKSPSIMANTKKNPDSGLLELQVFIMDFKCSADMIKEIRHAFYEDEKNAYQLVHILPGQAGMINISAEGNNPSTLNGRTSTGQEFLLLNMKNEQNPKLRDCYAIAWEEDNEEQNTIKGKVFVVTSTRPDLLLKRAQSEQAMFTIEGTVDESITDSCYNIYIADNHSEITEKDFVTCVPVVDKKFRYSINTDRMKAGRLRCIFPGGELCQAWIDLYFIPGMTIKLTVHDNYYEVENYHAYIAMVNSFNIIEAKEAEAEMLGEQDKSGGNDESIRAKLSAYKDMLSEIDAQFDEIRNASYISAERKALKKRLKMLHKQAQEITEKMNKLIDDYACDDN